MSDIYSKCFAFAAVMLLPFIVPHAIAVSGQADRPLYIIFDGSNSMWGELADKTRKIAAAKAAFAKLDASMFAGRDVALRLYGHRRAKDCSDTELAVPFTASRDAKAKLAKAINDVSPRGKTPISRSLTAALKDFNGRGGDILLISDGIETCDSDPCELIEAWGQQNIDIKVHVVGLGLNDMTRGAMQCIASASGTEYMDANDVGELSKAIEVTATAAAPVAGKAEPKQQTQKNEFKIVGADSEGNFLPVRGTISKPGMSPQQIKS
ncbi:MAG: vWA domain-containing protein, partial [Pseudomonadales bacterium]